MVMGEVKSPNIKPKTQSSITKSLKLPKGLIGSKSTANVKINGVDTGSQVTAVSQSFYNLYLSNHTIHPVSDTLEIEGANGQSLPYAGYVQLHVKFPTEFFCF